MSRLDALTVRETDGKSYWTRIGVAFQNREGPGYRVILDAMPASKDGQYIIHLREPRGDDTSTRGHRADRRYQPGDEGHIPGFD